MHCWNHYLVSYAETKDIFIWVRSFCQTPNTNCDRLIFSSNHKSFRYHCVLQSDSQLSFRWFQRGLTVSNSLDSLYWYTANSCLLMLCFGNVVRHAMYSISLRTNSFWCCFYLLENPKQDFSIEVEPKIASWLANC